MKIAINLLPSEFTQAEVKKAKFYKVQTVGVAVILLMVFLSSLSVALRILQNQNIKNVQTQVSAAQQKISELKDTQESILLLNNRLITISQYLGVLSKQTAMFALLDKLIPPQVFISSISVDKLGNVIILGLVPDSTTLDNLVNNLTVGSSLIKQVSVDTISRGKDGIYRISLKIEPN